MTQYVKPLEFETGQILGRSTIGILRDNDDFFNGLADRYRPTAAGGYRGFIGTETNPWAEATPFGAWDGWHYLEADAMLLHYYIKIENSDAVDLTRASLYYDFNGEGDPGTLIATQNGNGTTSGTYDLEGVGGYSAGFYRVFCRLWRDDGNKGLTSTVTCRAPWTSYTNGESYTAGHAIADHAASDVAHFNRWRDNDIYFNDIRPRQCACAGMARRHIASDLSTELFDGWIRWHPDQYRLYYSVALTSDLSNNRIVIYFDYDDVVAIQSTTISATGTTASSWTIGAPANWNKDTFYRVRVMLLRDNDTNTALGTVNYLWWTAPSLDASYTVMDPFTVDQWVYGDTAGQLTRLDYLTDNDASIYDRITFGNGSIGRMDYAVYTPEFVRLAGTDSGNYKLRRYGDTLIYRTEGAALTLPGGETEGLTDYDDPGTPYQTLDLNSIDLPYGSNYTISGSDIFFAQEM